ncbi:unnamed protein product [Musa hybrid cultivar]
MEKTVQECENLAARGGGAVLRHLARVHGGVQHVEPGDTRRHGGVDRRRQGGLDAAAVHDHRRKPRPGYRLGGVPPGSIQVRGILLPHDGDEQGVQGGPSGGRQRSWRRLWRCATPTPRRGTPTTSASRCSR